MAKPTYTIKKINPNGTEYDIVPTMMTDDTGTYKAELPSLTQDETIGLEPQVVHTLMTVSYATGSYTSTTSGRRSVRWYVSGVDGITQPYNGMKIAIKVPTPGLGTVGVVFSMNGNVVADYHPVAYNTALMTTQYAAGVVKMFTYDSGATLTPYVTQGTAAGVTGVWKCDGDYNTNSTGYLSYTATAVTSGSTVHYLVSKRVAAANGTNYYNSNVYYLGDGTLNAPTLSEGGTTLANKYQAKLPTYSSSNANYVLSVNSSGELEWRAYYNEELAD